ncbi:MAG: MFS transporter [Alphaproteobacteria bacterium]|mgnify:CR=1 FL=1|nr:MFS transporter [Alphaproteobacteria bacterium]OJV46607.1 MAG: hypothetical protein BGO28_04545 [Alphaproteobacteria bacterium 43-37]
MKIFVKGDRTKLLIASLVGQSIEFYDLALIAFFSFKISELYFPKFDSFISLLLSLITFGVGFLSRPVGAILFGYIGDKIGRKSSYQMSIVFMGIPMLVIAALPTYYQIGVWAPLILLLARFAQGLCVGGEYNGSAIFFLEHLKSSNKAFYSALISAGAIFGFFLAAFVAKIFSNDSLPHWAWRIPFFIGALVAFLGLYIRKNISETPVFQSLKERQNQVSFPLRAIYKETLLNSLATIGLGCCMGSISLTVVSYIPIHAEKFINFSHNLSVNLNLIGILFYMIFTIISGRLADKYSVFKILSVTTISILLLVFPIFYLLSIKNFYVFMCGNIMLGTLAGLLLGSTNYFLYQLYPAKIRYTGVCFNFAIGLALFGGTASIVNSLLAKNIGVIMGPATYLMFSSIIGLVSLGVVKTKKLLIHDTF